MKSEKGASGKKEAKYSKIEDEVEDYDDYMDEQGAYVIKNKKGKRDHEIYKDTYYIPNNKLKLLEVPMNSSRQFQMLLYYHSYYDILYGGILIPTGILKLMVGSLQISPILAFVFNVLYCLIEYFRINFGYKGNINESYPEMFAFFLHSFLFSLTFVIMPYTS